MRYSLIAGACLACGLQFSDALGGEPSAASSPADSPLPLARTDAATLEILITLLVRTDVATRAVEHGSIRFLKACAQ
jgi:hypothetical protein